MATATAAMTRQTPSGCAKHSGAAVCSNRSGRVNVAPRQTRALLTTQKHTLVGQQRSSRQARHGVCCRSVTEDLGVGGASQDEDMAIPVGKPDRPSITAQEEAKEIPAEAEEEAEDGPALIRENRSSAGKKTSRERVRDQRQEPGDVITDVPFKVGDLVSGKVLFSNLNGARVEMDCGIPGVVGYMMFNAGPHSLNQEGHHAKKSDIGPFRIPKGLVREFKIINIPDEMRENGVGPLISAKAVDEDIIWDRLDQMRNACEIDKVNFKVEITGTNKGGIRSRLQGMSLFVPYSFMPKCPEDTRWSEQVAEKIYMKEEVEVCLLDANREEQRLVGSMNQADTNRVLKAVYPGALVMGTVRKLEGFGAFVGIDNTHMSALLHVSNVSQGHLDHVSTIFAIGDRVACIVTEMENDGTRVSISTKQLEMYKGEMIEDRDAVMKNAEQRYAEYLEYEGYEY